MCVCLCVCISVHFINNVTLTYLSLQIIQRQLEQVEEKQRQLEERGVAVEKALRGEAGKKPVTHMFIYCWYLFIFDRSSHPMWLGVWEMLLQIRRNSHIQWTKGCHKCHNTYNALIMNILQEIYSTYDNYIWFLCLLLTDACPVRNVFYVIWILPFSQAPKGIIMTSVISMM